MTIFRQDFTISFFGAFVILSFVKIFHWLIQDRVDFIETTPNVTRLQHFRIVSFLAVLIFIDWVALRFSLAATMAHGVSVHLLFAFEYSVQMSTAITTLMKYALSVVDMATEGRWQGKGTAVFYLDLALDLLHLILYSVFFAVVFTTYGIPIHLMRDLYWTFRNFQTRVRDFLRYRRVAANMERRFPDATPEDLQRADHVCIVCREEMGPGSRAKRLDCSHTFHVHCLRSWLERQQNCPICRAPVLANAHQTHSHPAQPRAQQPPQEQEHAPEGGQRPQQRGAEAHAFDHGGPMHPEGGGRHLHGDNAAATPQETVLGADQMHPGQHGYYTMHPAVGGLGHYQYFPQYQAMPPMAMFVPGAGVYQMQFAGQERPDHVQAPAGGVVPLIPVPILVPLVDATWLGNNNGQQQTPEDMAAAAASAATAAAAATAGVMFASVPGQSMAYPSWTSFTQATHSAHHSAGASSAHDTMAAGPSRGGESEGQRNDQERAPAERELEETGIRDRPESRSSQNSETDELRRRRLQRFQRAENL